MTPGGLRGPYGVPALVVCKASSLPITCLVLPHLPQEMTFELRGCDYMSESGRTLPVDVTVQKDPR